MQRSPILRTVQVKPLRRHVVPYGKRFAVGLNTESLAHTMRARPRFCIWIPTPQSKPQLLGLAGSGLTPPPMSQRRLADWFDGT